MLFWAVSTWIAASAVAAAGDKPLPWEHGNGFRAAKIERIAPGQAGFSLIQESVSSLRFTNVLSQARILANANLMNGSGVALGDYDGDGWCDVYFCNLDGDNALFKNLGDWKFRDVTAETGVACPGQNATGAVFADVNGDGRLDLLVSSLGGPNSCFINEGNGRFVDRSEASGITSHLGATTLALADVDGNGTLDLYVANYGETSIIRSGGALNISYRNGKPVVRGRYAQRIQIVDNMMFELGEPDALLLNDGNGVFKPVSWTGGTFLDEDGNALREIPRDQGLTALFYDVNGDRAPDLYVCNDAFTPDRFWINDGRGKFRAMNRLGWRSTSHFSMGVDFADIDRDGHEDFFVVDMLSRFHNYIVTQKGNMPPQPRAPGDLLTQPQVRRNTLFQDRGDGTYAEIANLAGVAGSEWSWSGMFLDVDLDGWEDLLVSNGFPFNMDDMDAKQKVRSLGQLSVEQSRRSLLLFSPLLTPNMAFRNERNLKFSDASGSWGFHSTNISNGFAFGDLDNDGDLDVVVNCLNAPALLYRNNADAPRIAVRLKGKAPNTQGIGAKIRVEGGPVAQTQQVISGGRYVSGDDPMRVFACGTNQNRLRIEVTWRNGSVSIVENAKANHIYEIDEAGGRTMAPVAVQTRKPMFAEVSSIFNHTHHEMDFNDFEAQPSLPIRLSRFGPGLCWFDVDADGWDDLIIGAGRGGNVSLLRNEQGQRFTPIKLNIRADDDISSVIARRSGNDATELIVGVNAWETGTSNRLLRFELRGTNVTSKGALPVSAAVGPLALTELRGKMVLFAGGRVKPRRYPEPAPSHFFELHEGKWMEDEKTRALFARLGLVTGAVFSDLNGDGTPELVVSCEWGTLRVFDFAGAEISETTKEWGLDGLAGRWQSVAAGDINADGKMDLVAGNWGLNSFESQAADGQSHLFFGDFNGQGMVEMIEAYRDGTKIVPWRDMQILGNALPWLPQKFSTHAAYAQASAAEILGERASRAVELRTTTMASTVFLNRGRRFEAVQLPLEAQYTPVFGISIADFDNDGFQDVALAQNFFGLREHDGALDAGRGLLLRGGAGGKLTPMSGSESGFIAHGEQRGLAASDFNRDGRIDFAVGQNGTDTKLWANRQAKPGVRLRLIGSELNPDAFGAHIQPDNGPAMEIRAGGGFWSQESAAKIVPHGTKYVRIRWPSGKSTNHPVPEDATEMVLSEGGN